MDVDFQGIYGSFNVVHDAEYTRYMKIAATLNDDDNVSEICYQLLDTTSATFDRDVQFVFLGGSYGSGKSQMAFNIMSRLGMEILFSF
jgi:2-phosphoglycerate kinase